MHTFALCCTRKGEHRIALLSSCVPCYAFQNDFMTRASSTCPWGKVMFLAFCGDELEMSPGDTSCGCSRAQQNEIFVFSFPFMVPPHKLTKSCRRHAIAILSTTTCCLRLRESLSKLSLFDVIATGDTCHFHFPLDMGHCGNCNPTVIR